MSDYKAELTPNDMTKTYGVGFSMLTKMGYKAGQGLGKNSEGIVNPLKVDPRLGKSGIQEGQKNQTKQNMFGENSEGKTKFRQREVKKRERKKPRYDADESTKEPLRGQHLDLSWSNVFGRNLDSSDSESDLDFREEDKEMSFIIRDMTENEEKVLKVSNSGTKRLTEETGYLGRPIYEAKRDIILLEERLAKLTNENLKRKDELERLEKDENMREARSTDVKTKNSIIRSLTLFARRLNEGERVEFRSNFTELIQLLPISESTEEIELEAEFRLKNKSEFREKLRKLALFISLQLVDEKADFFDEFFLNDLLKIRQALGDDYFSVLLNRRLIPRFFKSLDELRPFEDENENFEALFTLILKSLELWNKKNLLPGKLLRLIQKKIVFRLSTIFRYEWNLLESENSEVFPHQILYPFLPVISDEPIVQDVLKPLESKLKKYLKTSKTVDDFEIFLRVSQPLFEIFPQIWVDSLISLFEIKFRSVLDCETHDTIQNFLENSGETGKTLTRTCFRVMDLEVSDSRVEEILLDVLIFNFLLQLNSYFVASLSRGNSTNLVELYLDLKSCVMTSKVVSRQQQYLVELEKIFGHFLSLLCERLLEKKNFEEIENFPEIRWRSDCIFRVAEETKRTESQYLPKKTSKINDFELLHKFTLRDVLENVCRQRNLLMQLRSEMKNGKPVFSISSEVKKLNLSIDSNIVYLLESGNWRPVSIEYLVSRFH